MVGHFIVSLHVMYHNMFNYNLVSLGFKLHNAHTIIIKSSTCFLFIQLCSVSDKVLNSLIHLIAFSTLMQMLAISLDYIACCPVSLPSDKKPRNTTFVQINHVQYILYLLIFTVQAVKHQAIHYVLQYICHYNFLKIQVRQM